MCSELLNIYLLEPGLSSCNLDLSWYQIRIIRVNSCCKLILLGHSMYHFHICNVKAILDKLQWSLAITQTLFYHAPMLAIMYDSESELSRHNEFITPVYFTETKYVEVAAMLSTCTTCELPMYPEINFAYFNVWSCLHSPVISAVSDVTWMTIGCRPVSSCSLWAACGGKSNKQCFPLLTTLSIEVVCQKVEHNYLLHFVTKFLSELRRNLIEFSTKRFSIEQNGKDYCLLSMQ